jgi:hypothetical protein
VLLEDEGESPPTTPYPPKELKIIDDEGESSKLAFAINWEN